MNFVFNRGNQQLDFKNKNRRNYGDSLGKLVSLDILTRKPAEL